MAGNKETRQFNSSAKEKGFLGRGKDKALWVAEKSTWVTLPITAGLFAAKKISLETALVMAVLDIGGSVVAKRLRNKEQKSSVSQIRMMPGREYAVAKAA
jgi:hypothetical protein